MIQHYIIGVGAFLLVSVAWLGVQRAWRRAFSDSTDDPDALAGRSGCRGCADSTDCHRKQENRACEAEEKRP